MDHYLNYQKQSDFLSTRWLSVASILAIIVAVALARAVSAYRTRQLFPAVDSGLTKSIYDAEPLYREGYRKFKDTPYRVTTADGRQYLAHLQTNGNQAYDGHIELTFFLLPGDHLMIPNALFEDFYRVLEKDPDAADLAQRVVSGLGLDCPSDHRYSDP